MPGWRSGQCKVKMAVLPSSRRPITEHNLIWYVEKLQWELIIPILIALFQFPYFYSHSHSHSFDIVVVTPIPMVIRWDPWDPNYSHSYASLLYVYVNTLSNVAGVTSRDILQFSGVRSVLLGSYAVRHQESGLGDAGYYGNDSRWISQRRCQYISWPGTWWFLVSKLYF